ncbi:hypothetical protein JS532_09210 [Bifidobacterium callimiconis]|nr:hypothetical protein [Bifidobacterium callimiconis]MBT1177732.1 hypothetical protein [Bifidobacterium callimiconis]
MVAIGDDAAGGDMRDIEDSVCVGRRAEFGGLSHWVLCAVWAIMTGRNVV